MNQVRERVAIEDVEAGKSYWLTLGWHYEGMWREPIYSGRVLSYDADTVTVEIDVMGPHGRGSALETKTHPRKDLKIEKLPEESESA